MKKLYIIAALLMATTSAHAGNGISFEINGERIRVEAPRNCNALSCIKITAPGYSGTVGNIDLKGIGSKNKDDDDVADTTPAKPAAAPAPAPVQAAAPQPARPAPRPMSRRRPRRPLRPPRRFRPMSAPLPFRRLRRSPLHPPRSRPRLPQPPCPIRPRRSASGRPKRTRATCASKQCGANLCGYSVKSGEKILISMKPEGSKWTGRIHDPDSGRNYDSTIAMKGTTSLRVQGCAFGGMFCGGQTWKRVS